MIDIIKDINILKKVSQPVDSVKEALSIIEKIKEPLENEKNSIGLAAIQIGINKKISVLKKEFFSKKEYFYLINPKIIETNEKFLFFNEGCLSFPGQFFNTYRYKHFIIENDRINGDQFEKEQLYFYYSIDKNEATFGTDNPIVSIAIQHEIDHFEGKVITEYCEKNVPIKKDKEKIGRNDPCPCGSGKKFKKCCGK